MLGANKTLYVLLRGAAAEQLTYRFDLLSNLLLMAAYYGIQLLFFNRVFDLSASLGGWTREDVYLVFFIYLIIMLSVEMVASSVNRFFYFVHLGTAEPFLVKPCGVVSIMLLRWSQPAFAVVAILIVAIVVSLGAANSLEISATANLHNGSMDDVSVWKSEALRRYTGFGIGIAAGWIANLSLVILLNTITFVIQRQIPVDYIHGELGRLSILPTDLFPRHAFISLMITIPMVFAASAPVAFLKGDTQALAWLVASSLTLLAVTCWVFFAASKKFEGLGG